MNLNHRSKYSAVAAAVAVACAVGANTGADAATVQAGETLTLASQFIAAASASTSQNVTFGVSLGADYVASDRIRVVLAGAQFQTTASISAPTGTASAGGAPATCTLSVLGFADATTVNFRVPSSLPNGTPCVFTLPIKTSTVGTSATLSFSSLFSTGEALEAATTAKTVITTADQFSASVVKTLAGVVDVETARYHFVADDTSGGSALTGNESQLVLSLANATAAMSSVGRASVAAVTVTVAGDFTWLDDESSGFGTCTAGDLIGGNARSVLVQASGVAQAGSLNCGTLSYVISGSSAGEFTGGHVTIAMGKTNAASSTAGTYDRTIPAPQSYSTGVTFSYFSAGTAATALSAAELTSASAGSFTLNGSTIYVPFLPYNSSTTRVVYLTNRSDQTGAVTASGIADGTGAACPSFTVTNTAKANGVTLLTAGIDAGIRACYGADFDGKVAVTIVSNIPGGKAEIFSAYNRNGSLTAVSNSSNGRDSTNTRN